jgi:tape measure domain-containing protein
MSGRISEWIEINITVDPSHARTGLAALNRQLISAKQLQGIGKDIGDSWGKVQPILGGIERALQAVGVAALATGSALYYASKQAGDFEALANAVEALEGGPTKARSVLANLREIARAPGLGVQESIQGYAALRRSGLAEDISYRLVRELGNQNALAGGGRAELAGLLMVFSDIKNKGTLQREEALQLAERGMPIFNLLEQAFGTKDTEALAKQGKTAEEIIAGLVAVMEDGARVAAGAKNSHENFADAIEQGIIAIGTGANRAGFTGALDAMAEVLEKLTNDGVLEQFGAYFGDAIGRMIGSAEDFEEAAIYAGATVIDLAWKFENILIPAVEKLWQAFKPFWWHKDVGDAMAGGMDIRQSYIDTWRAEADMRRRQRERREAQRGMEEAGGDTPGLGDLNARIATATERTATATERMAADLRDFVIGGGDLAGRGFTRADRSDYSGLAVNRRRGGVSLHSISAMGGLRFQPGN